MNTIFKTWKKATYFKGYFELRSENENWANPIDFPTVFEAYGKAIKSGNWRSCININTPEFVIDNYFDKVGRNKHENMYSLWECCKQLEKIKWSDVTKNKKEVLDLVQRANDELKKLKIID